MASTRHPPTNDTTELAKERNRAAAERTLTSWIQNCLTIIGFGIAFDRILTAVNQRFPQNSSSMNQQLTHAIGLGAIALGILLLLSVITVYLVEIRTLDREDHLIGPLSVFNEGILVGAIIIFGAIALFAIFFVFS
ncbi:MAG: DUF202 domain-containing protein [Cyanobacteria bacterium P01_G01_bin.49]